MIPRLLVLSYFAFYMIGFEVSGIVGVTSARIVGFVPAGLYLAYRTGQAILRSRPVFLSKRVWGSKNILVFFYVAAYCLLYLMTRMTGGPLSSGAVFGYAYAAVLFIHVSFWYNIFSDPVYRGDYMKLVRDILGGIVITFLVLGFLPAVSVGELQPGGLYHVRGDQVPFFITSLDTPLLAAIAGLISWAGVQRTWERRKSSGGVRIALGLLAFALAVYTLVLYSRRGPLFGFVIAFVAMLLVSLLSRLRLSYGVLSLGAIPFLWTYAVEILIYLTQNEVVASVLARNTAEAYRTATGRLGAWEQIIEVIANVRLQHLWGYGESALLLGYGVISHAHNTYLQLFYETGLIGLVPALFLILSTLGNFNEMVRKQERSAEILSLWAIFVLLIVVSSTESLMKEVYLGHLLLTQMFIISCNLKTEKEKGSGKK